MPRKRKLYLSELLNRFVPKSYQFINIYNVTGEKRFIHEHSIGILEKIPKEMLDKQVDNWEYIESTHSVYIYLK